MTARPHAPSPLAAPGAARGAQSETIVRLRSKGVAGRLAEKRLKLELREEAVM